MIAHSGPRVIKWLADFFSDCSARENIPATWRKAKVIALPKPGKDHHDPKNYRPISLLCHIYKLYERIILNRLVPTIEPQTIPEQAGFRAGKSTRS